MLERDEVVDSARDQSDRHVRRCSKLAYLVAMASHGWGGSVRTLYGSVASGVINKTDQPLLIVRSRSFPEPD